MQTGFYKSRPIVADIGGCLLAAFTGTGDRVALATAPGQPLAGITDTVGGKAGYGLVDLQLSEIADIRFGGTVAAGDPITADAQGRGVKAVKPGAGATVYIIGFAQGPGVVDDIGKVLVAPQILLG